MTDYLFPLGSSFIWSTNFIIGRMLAGQVPPWTLTAARFTIAAAILLPLLISRGSKPGRRELGLLILAGASGVFLFNSLLYIGLSYTTATSATLVNSLSPLATAVMTWIFWGEGFSLRRGSGIILSLAGVAWIVTEGHFGRLLSLDLNPGDLIVLLDTFVWAFYSVICRILVGRLGTLETSGWSIVIGVPMLWPAAALELAGTGLGFLNAKTLAAFIYLGLFPSVIAFWLWSHGILRLGPSRVSLLYNAIPVFGALLAWLFLGEAMAPHHWAGGMLVVIGTYIGSSASNVGKNSSSGQTNVEN